MSGESISPNMGLTIPGAGVTTGPLYASEVNTSLNVIDSHNHSNGSGVPITPSGISINADLPFGGNNATGLRSVRLNSQGSPISGASDVGCAYVSGVDLYYNDGSGTQIRITQSGGVAGAPGNISGLIAPASASYAANTFVWQSAANTPANLDAASVVFRNNSVGANGVTVNPAAALPSNYNLYLPTLPAQQNFMTLDSAGNISAPWNVDNSTLVIASNSVKVATAGITTTQIANNTVAPVNMATNWQMQNISRTSGTYGTGSTSLTIGSITTIGRPVIIMMTSGRFTIPSFDAGSSVRVTLHRIGSAGVTTVLQTFLDMQGTNQIGTYNIATQPPTGNAVNPLSAPLNQSFSFVDVPTAGWYQYKFAFGLQNGYTNGGTTTFSSVSCLMYEM